MSRLSYLSSLKRTKKMKEDGEKCEEDLEWNESGVEVNWQSLFSELLLEENASALKSYLACTNYFLL